MANLTADRTDDFLAGSGREQRLGIAASTTLFQAAIVGFNAAGFLVHADVAAANKPLTIVTKSGNDNDNSAGANGDQRATVAIKNGDYTFLITSGAVTIANIGDPIFASDSNTITATPNTKPLGILVDYVDGIAWILVI